MISRVILAEILTQKMEQKCKILILEDFPADAELARRAISDTLDDCSFKMVESRQEFVDALEEFGPDAIVADYQLPGFDGIEAMKIALEKEPLTPFIMHTGSINEETAVECMKEGATDYVLKEDIKRLGSAVKRALEIARLKRETLASQQALRESEARFRELAENASDLLYRYELIPEKKFSYVCPAFTTVTGYSPEELYADPLLPKKIIHPGDLLLINNISEGRTDTEKPLTLRLSKKDGSRLWTEHKIVYVRDSENNLTAIEGIARDVTERRQAEEKIRKALEKAEQSDRLKTAFLNNLSHEIRTPLNAITGFSDILMEPGISRDQIRNCINIIRMSSSQLIRVVEDIIHISTIETGQLEIFETRVNVNRLFDRIRMKYRDRAEHKGIGLEIHPGQGNPEIATDQDKLEYVLSQLVDNAIKFSDKGSVEVSCDIKGGYISFSVSDAGIGVDPEMLSDIFRRFHQTAIDISQKRGGLGLGLPISKAFIESLGGKIWAESVPGNGSVFSFCIPCKPSRQPGTVEDNVFEPAAGKKLLVAEDEETNFLLIREIISSGIEIIHAANGKEAVELIEKHPDIDLVLMDIKMPVMDGNEARKKIKGIRPSLPVVALTAHALPGDREWAIGEGFDGYLSKPFMVNELRGILEQYLGLSG
jgi:PAS domain S-box-containing protein